MFQMRTTFVLQYCLAHGAALRFGEPPPAFSEHTVDLDLPPYERWKNIIRAHGPDIITAVKSWKADLDRRVPSTKQEPWVYEFKSKCPNEYLQELAGIHAELLQFPSSADLFLSSLMLYQLSHELEERKRVVAGAEVLAVDFDGTVLQAARRNHPKDAKTIMVRFNRGWKLSLVGQVEVGSVGVIAGLKPKEWSFALRGRQVVSEEDMLDNQLARLKAGALPMMVFSRQIIEQNGNYDDAVAMVRDPLLTRAAYFSFAGSTEYEGAVVSRSAKPAYRRIKEVNSANNIDSWFVVQATGDVEIGKYTALSREGIKALQKPKQREIHVDLVAAAAAKADEVRSETSLIVMVPRSGKICLPKNNSTDQMWVSRYCYFFW